MRTFKTKKKLSGVAKEFKKWAEYDEGDTIVGKYVDVHEDETYGKTHRVIEVEFANVANKAWEKSIVGKNLVLNSCGIVDSVFEKVSLGEYVQVTYEGTSVIEKGKFKGKDAHNISIEIVELDEEEEEQIVEDEL
jgi:hypothetical protein